MHWVHCSKASGKVNSPFSRAADPGNSAIPQQWKVNCLVPGTARSSFPCSKRQRTLPCAASHESRCQLAKLLGGGDKASEERRTRQNYLLARPTHPYLCHSLSKNVPFHVIIFVSKQPRISLTDSTARKEGHATSSKTASRRGEYRRAELLTSLDSTVAGGRQCWRDVQGRCFNNAKWTFI
jgi:hypothetical protein